MLRLGLCYVFRKQPIKIRATTASSIKKLPRKQALSKLSELCQRNASVLPAALTFCYQKGIGYFRVNSQIMLLRTHPGVGYQLEDLPNAREVVDGFRASGVFAPQHRSRIKATAVALLRLAK